MNTWYDMNFDEKKNRHVDLRQWLLKQRMSQAGYDRADFVLLKNRAQKLRKLIRYQGVSCANHFAEYKMLVVTEDTFSLAFQKTFNEDLIKLMQLLTRPINL